ncbi:unnamed protein product [Didymodactylos carnosus]|uniref:Uncharacterized protein n=1 Tax=Didymodactylos carnosus TaxID=1234261 RepID=A0A816A545_9BILA|nr:unnamed protein product [Didymodactylos carnosus]CAF4466577.1 unnamed protein product [Didymodactylos carnosus]
MKRVAHSVRIGFVRRGFVSPEPDEYQSSPKVQQLPHQQSALRQFWNRRISRSAPLRDEVQNQQYIVAPGTPQNVRLHDITEANNSKQHYPEISSSSSLPSTPSVARQPMRIQEQTTTHNPHKIPSTAK